MNKVFFKIAFLVIVLVVSYGVQPCFAQSVRLANGLSVNLTTPLIQAINKNKPDSTSLRLATNIAYNRMFGKRWMMRIGFGGTNNHQTIASDIYTNRTVEYNTRISGLLSFFKMTTINANWNFGLGPSISGIFNRTDVLSDSGFDILNEYEYNNGGGAGLGVFFEYKLNKRLSMFTEYHMLYNLYNSAQGKEFSAYPDQNYSRTKQFNQGIQLQYPLAIYINYAF
jgi:hypothetical protein